MWLSYIGFLTDLTSSGLPALKLRSHEWRQEGLQKESKRLFQASTVSRSLEWEMSEKKVQKAREEAIGRWTKARPVNRALLAEIDRYIDRLPLDPPTVEFQPVTPNDKACLGYPRNKGGQAAAAKKLVDDELEAQYQAARDNFTRAASGTWSEKVGHVDHSSVVETLQRVTIEQRETSIMGPTNTQVLDAAKKKFRSQTDHAPPPLEPTAITELGGKVRVVTLHSVEEVVTARNVTAHWLKALRRVVTVRDSLRGEDIVLESLENGKLFSADLSAATDYIDHEVAQRFALRLHERIGGPVELDLILRMLGPHRLSDGTVTSSGIHMGLGPTWVILNLINGFAAWYAGARVTDHRMCGDDLIGLWKRHRADKYVNTLEELGLVVNKSKSFFTEAGVFCERLVLRHTLTTARSHDVGHLSQASAARVIANRTTATLCVAEDLWSEPHFPVLSREVAQSLTPRVPNGGPLRLGGNGRKVAGYRQLEAALVRGNVKLVKPAYRLPRGATTELRGLEKEVGDVPVSELLITATTRLRLADNFKGKKSKQGKTLRRKEFLQEAGVRRRKFLGTKESLSSAIRASSLRSEDRKICLWLVNRPPKISSTRRLKWLQRVITRPRAERYLTRDEAMTWLESISPIRWELGPTKNSKNP
jgi:hypothetical protein